jgi:hypothetical protein
MTMLKGVPVKGSGLQSWLASVRRYSTHRQQRTSSSDRSALRQLESPMARLAQEHPMLYLLGFFGMNNG